MNVTQKNKLDAMERMLVFVTDSSLPPPLENAPAGFQEQITVLRSAIEEASQHATNQESGHPLQLTQLRRRLRNQLRYEHLQPLRDVSRVIEKETPGLPSLVNLPGKAGTERRLIAAANAALRDILPYRDKFISRGLPSDFLAQLEAAITSLKDVKIIHADAVSKRTAASQGIASAIANGMSARKCLSAVVKRSCLQDPESGPATLHAWQSVSRIRRSGSSSVTEEVVNADGLNTTS